jgi:Protein of unknown function (DUF3313)
MKTPRLLLVVFLGSIAALSGGCATSSSGLKAKTVKPSAFLENPGRLKPHRERAPFNLSWENPQFETKRGAYNAIAVAPVTTAYLRPVDRPLVTALEGPKAKDRPVAATAGLLRTGFTEAFQAPGSRFATVSGKGPRVLTLELALVEMNPTNVVGNMARYGAPGGSALAPATKGNIAIEGKLRDSMTGELLYEFADNEQDKFSVVSLRDLSSYGHARTAIKEWAKQFAELLRTAASHKVEDSSTVTLNPF